MKSAFALNSTRLFVGLALAGLASSAVATTWNSSACNPYVGTGAGNYCTWTTSNGYDGSTAAAWSSTASGPAFATATLAYYSGGGFGVTNQLAVDQTGPPQHATDNNGATDLVAYSFATSVILKDVVIGWNQTDTDISVLRYKGATDVAKPASLALAIQGKTFSQLINTATGGWELVKNSYGTGSSSGSSTDQLRTIQTGAGAETLSSSWWLVSAYNAGYSGGTPGSGDDYVKILSVSGDKVTPPQVPEPGSLALMGVALVGLMGMRRKART